MTYKTIHKKNAMSSGLQELFCLQPIVFGWRQNSSSSYFASEGKIKTHDFSLADQDWIRLKIFKNLEDQDWMEFNFIGSGLDSDWKISVRSSLAAYTTLKCRNGM